MVAEATAAGFTSLVTCERYGVLSRVTTIEWRVGVSVYYYTFVFAAGVERCIPSALAHRIKKGLLALFIGRRKLLNRRRWNNYDVYAFTIYCDYYHNIIPPPSAHRPPVN